MKTDISKLAALAKLRLTDDECASLEPELERMIDFAAQCISDASELTESGASASHLREDIPHECTDRAEILANSRDTDGKYFTVPRVVEA